LPADAYRGRSRMAYCAVLGKARMLAYGELIEQAGLELASIDITEMAFRNLGLLAGAEGVNIGLLSLRASEGLICVQNGADLYMARRIEQGTQQAGLDAAGVTLEIQRSLDYFESQLGKGYLNRLLLGPTAEDGGEALIALGAGLAVNLQALELAALFPSEAVAALPEAEQARCLAAVGAALRREVG
jgi:MSHA biogenesis protein MshI